MSYLYTVLQDAPIGLWTLDAVTSGKFTDYSGNGFDATVVGGVANDKPVVAGGVASQLLSGAGFTLPISGLMQAGYQNKPFSFEFWVSPVATAAGSLSLFTRTTSGITISGNTVTVTLSMASTITLSYAGLAYGNDYHVVVTYDTLSVYMYVNGKLVASADVTPDNYAAGFTDTATTLSFSATGGYTALFDAIAVYNRALTGDVVSSHADTGFSFPDVERISDVNGSHRYRISDDYVTIFDRLTANDDDSWSRGVISGSLQIVDDVLQNFYSDTTSQYETGTWTAILSIEPQVLTLAGSRITWDSNKINTDLVVQVSTDGGTTFTTVTNGGQPVGAADLSTGLDVVVKVTVAAGATQTIVSRLNLVLYTSKDIYGTDSDLPLVVSSPALTTLAEFDYEPAEFNGNGGIYLPGPSTRLSVAADPVFGGYQAIEFTIRPDTTQNSKTILASSAATAPPGITTNTTGQWVGANLTALYIDGVSVSTTAGVTVAAGTWHHVVVVFPATSSTLYLANNAANSAAYACRIGYAATYFTSLSAATVTAMYNAWVGTAPTRIIDSSVVTIREHVLANSLPVRGYGYTWSVSPAG